MRGLTLIETIIYIGLLGMLMIGAMTTVYSLLESGVAVSTDTTTQDEGNFVLAKIAWALGSQSNILVPSSSYDTSLTLIQEDGTSITIRQTGETVEMRVDAGAYLPLTSSNVEVESLGFMRSGFFFSASTTIDGEVFELHRYLRK